MQGLVDHRGIFLDVNIGWPGKVHNARVFANSSLYKKEMNSFLFPNWKRTLSGVQVRVCVYVGVTVKLMYRFPFCRYPW